ncbi:MAG: hypothetical protein V2J24_08485, partial [Pseudomonadales bacterium]|nr:hypothetical protein [Pseudomonadales bacterium]
MNEPTPRRRGILASIGAGITALRTFLANVLFVLLLVVIFVALLSSTDEVGVVPNGGALVLRLDGPVVEDPPEPDPLALLFRDEDAPRALVLRDLVDGL